MTWEGKVKIKGDLRLHQEFRNDENRQRYRARIAVKALLLTM